MAIDLLGWKQAVPREGIARPHWPLGECHARQVSEM